MLPINQFNLEPGIYVHYKDGGLYTLETIVTHIKVQDVWTKLQDPWVCYKNLDAQYEKINDQVRMVQKAYMRPLSEFTADVDDGKGGKVKRFRFWPVNGEAANKPKK